MEVILKEDIKNLGYKNDLVNVKGGYGRNYLIPKGLALVASESNKKRIAENVKQASHKAAKIKQDAETLAQSIGEVVLEISSKAGENGKIFGAVTALQISEALKSKGFEVDRKKISFKTPVKTLGDYLVVIDLHREVQPEVSFTVVKA
jgi:large subunit ribosomal protein L9